MQPNQVRTTTESKAAIAIVTMAFSADPAARWMYPDSNDYLQQFPRFVEAFGGKAFQHGSAHVAGDGCAAALWLPPDVSPDEDKLLHILQTTVHDGIRADLMSVFDQMGSYYPPVPHWYLPLIGVDMPFQNRGYGAALLRHALRQCDIDRMPAYLESSNPRNISLYERHGFERIGEIQAGSSPSLYPMLRKPR